MDAPLLLKNTGTSLILCDSNGKPIPVSVILHAGLVLYAWSRRRQIFGSDWSWN